jgi:hypothetical protein
MCLCVRVCDCVFMFVFVCAERRGWLRFRVFCECSVHVCMFSGAGRAVPMLRNAYRFSAANGSSCQEFLPLACPTVQQRQPIPVGDWKRLLVRKPRKLPEGFRALFGLLGGKGRLQILHKHLDQTPLRDGAQERVSTDDEWNQMALAHFPNVARGDTRSPLQVFSQRAYANKPALPDLGNPRHVLR